MTPVRGEAGACVVPGSVDKPVENFVGIGCWAVRFSKLGFKISARVGWVIVDVGGPFHVKQHDTTA